MIAFLARLLEDLAAEIGSIALSGPRAAAGLRAALASVIAVLIAIMLQLDNPWWAGLTGMVLVQKTATATWARSVDRVIGTLIGAAVGYICADAIDDHLLFALICVVVTAFTIYGQARVQHNYAVLLGGVTVMLVLFQSLQTPGVALHLAVYRAMEIVVGVSVAALVDYAFLTGPAPPVPAATWPGIFTRPVDQELAAAALSGGVAIALMPFVWDGLELPGLGQTPITAFVILIAIRGDPVRRAATRMLGCLIGGLYGLVAMHVVGDAFLPWVMLLGLGLFASANLAQGDSDVSYVGLQAAIAIIIAMVQGLHPSSDILPAIDRLAGVLGGVVLVALCHPVFTPLFRFLLDFMDRRGPAEPRQVPQ